MSVSIVAYGQARSVYYDRNPSRIQLQARNENLAPHGITTRAAYTVPTNRKAFLESGFMHTERITAAAPPLRVSNIFSIIGITIVDSNLESVDNGIGNRDDKIWTGTGFVEAGIQTTLTDADLSTGGTVTFENTFKATEYDA